jgi:hypothetical protein
MQVATHLQARPQNLLLLLLLLLLFGWRCLSLKLPQ